MHDVQSALSLMLRVAAFDAGRYAFAVTAMLIVVASASFVGASCNRIQQRRHRAHDVRRELFSSLRSVAVYAAIVSPILWGMQSGVLRNTVVKGASPWMVAGTTLGLVLAHDTWFYWTHRLMHLRRLYRTLHRHHHRSVSPTAFAAYSFSVPEAAVHALFMALWLLLFPAPWISLFAFLAILVVRDVVSHSGYEMMPSTFAEHWFWGNFTTATHHDLHHQGDFGKNLGLYFVWWDRLMGTEAPDYQERFRAATLGAGSPRDA